MINKRPHEADGLFDDNESWLSVSVEARVLTDGQIIPLNLDLDAQSYKIERILDCRSAKTRKSLRAGTRYLVLVEQKQLVLYLDRQQWYLALEANTSLF